MPMSGYSFTPGAGMTDAVNARASLLSPQASTALRILSLNLPAVLAGNPIGPTSLLNGSWGRLPMMGAPTSSAPSPAPPRAVDAGGSPTSSPGPAGSMPLMPSMGTPPNMGTPPSMGSGTQTPGFTPSPTIGFGAGTQTPGFNDFISALFGGGNPAASPVGGFGGPFSRS